MDMVLPDGMLKSLLISGVIDGVGGVLGFVPLIMFMFFGISILEDSGYLARVAFMLDRVFSIFEPHTEWINKGKAGVDRVSIEILVHGNDGIQAQITCDGQVNFDLAAGDRVRIRRKDHDLRLLHPVQHDHFEVMRKKLRWAEQP